MDKDKKEKNAKGLTNVAAKSEKAVGKENSKEPEPDQSVGIPMRDLKKNLGCGG